MMTQEETRVLRRLYRRGVVAAQDLRASCSPGGPKGWGERVLGRLEWLGCVTVFYSGDGLPALVEITQRGIDALYQGGC
jgi:hypothetical protein